MSLVRARGSRRPLAAGLTVALVVAGLAVAPRPVGADPACAVLRQLTDDSEKGTYSLDISADGTRVVFAGDGDLAGGNADESKEIFWVDLASGDTTQVTSSAGGDVDVATISADGTRLAFSMDRDLVGKNADLSFEIFLHDTVTSETTQLTGSSGDSFAPSFSTDGTRIAYARIDGGSEIVVHDTVADEDTPVTGGAAGFHYGPQLSGDGRYVVFESDGDLVGDNADGTSEIFLHDLVEEETIQLTDSADEASMFPDISADGSTVAFSSRADLLGTNPEGNLELFLYDVATEDLTQLTVTTEGTNSGAHLSADGSRVSFTAASDLLGLPVSWEAVVYDVTDDVFTPLTDTPTAITAGTAISADGTQYIVRSRANYFGGNPDTSFELYWAACGSATPTFSDVTTAHAFFDQIEWMAAAKVSTGYGDGTYRPALPVSRGAMAAFLHRLAGSPEVTPPDPPTFTDVDETHAFFEEIEWMAAAEVSTGYPDDTFRPGATVSRGAMAAFLHRLAGSPDVTPPDPPTFSDVDETHAFFEEVEWMAAAEVSTGYPDDTFRPGHDVSRGAMSAFVHRLAAGPGVGI